LHDNIYFFLMISDFFAKSTKLRQSSANDGVLHKYERY
jgi:hypothetical protein